MRSLGCGLIDAVFSVIRGVVVFDRFSHVDFFVSSDFTSVAVLCCCGCFLSSCRDATVVLLAHDVFFKPDQINEKKIFIKFFVILVNLVFI